MANYWVFLPETILVVVAFASIVLGFAWAKKPTYLWALALAGTLVALFINVDMMGLGVSSALGLNLWPSSAQLQLQSAGDFSSTLKLIETVFHLPSLGTRDATSSDLLEAFNFGQKPAAGIVLPGPFVADHYPLTFPNGTVYHPQPEGQPASPLTIPSTTALEYPAALVAGVSVLIVAMAVSMKRPGVEP